MRITNILNFWTFLYFSFGSTTARSVNKVGKTINKATDENELDRQQYIDENGIKITKTQDSCRVQGRKQQFFVTRRISEDEFTYVSWIGHKNTMTVDRSYRVGREELEYAIHGEHAKVEGSMKDIEMKFGAVNPLHYIVEKISQMPLGELDCAKVLDILTIVDGVRRPFNWLTTFLTEHKEDIKQRDEQWQQQKEQDQLLRNIKVTTKENSCTMTDKQHRGMEFLVSRVNTAPNEHIFISWKGPRNGVVFWSFKNGTESLDFNFMDGGIKAYGPAQEVRKQLGKLHPFRSVTKAITDILTKPGDPDCEKILYHFTTIDGDKKTFQWVNRFLAANKIAIKKAVDEMNKVPRKS